MKDTFLRRTDREELTIWTCPSCDADCEVKTKIEAEVWCCAETMMEYERQRENIETCLGCGYILEHNSD